MYGSSSGSGRSSNSSSSSSSGGSRGSDDWPIYMNIWSGNVVVLVVVVVVAVVSGRTGDGSGSVWPIVKLIASSD